MFTGLIEAAAAIERIEASGVNRRLWITHLSEGSNSPALGESVAVDGACLTVEHLDGRRVGLFASAETLERTTLGRRRIGDRVNLERSLSLGDRLGGHLVMGHVDGVGRFLSVQRRGEDFWCEFEIPAPRWRPFLVEKGSVAVDGISLTVASLEDDRFAVSIIPYTWQHTTLHERRPGDSVNLEFDLIGKYILRWLAMREQPGGPPPGGVSLDILRQAGFV
jgi:riboflavin synthase